MTEDFIKNQEAMIENFESALKDKYPSGSVPTKAALVDFLTEFFPVKSEERMEEVLEALDEHARGVARHRAHYNQHRCAHPATLRKTRRKV